jgi:hypothetical protein
MGIYTDTGRVVTGPMRDTVSYGTDRDKVRWAMMSADSRCPYAHPDRRDDFVMTAAVRRSAMKRQGVKQFTRRTP